MPLTIGKVSPPRRRLLAVMTVLAVLNVSQSVLAQNTELPFQLVLPSELMPGLREAATYSKLTIEGDPSSVDPTRGLPLVYIAIGVMMLPDIARSLIAAYRDYKYGGVVVETRNGKLIITHDAKLDADTMIVKDGAGKITVHKNRSGADTAKWVEVLASATKK